MSEIMRVGIAGLGTVGAAVARLLRRQAEALTARTGRRIVLAGVSARDATKERRRRPFRRGVFPRSGQARGLASRSISSSN